MKKSLLLSTALVAVFAATQAFARDIIRGEVNISNIENKTDESFDSDYGTVYFVNAKGILNIENSYFANKTNKSDGGVISSSTPYKNGLTTAQTREYWKKLWGHDAANIINIKNSTFENNTVDIWSSGAIGVYSDVKIENSKFIKNIVKGPATNKDVEGGGAIYFGGWSRADITGTTFESNEAAIGGAISTTRNDSSGISGDNYINIASSIFNKNKAVEHGGAIYSSFTNNKIANSSFVENSANMGGALALVTGKNGQTAVADIISSTFTNNAAESKGGAIYNTGNINFSGNNVFSGNTAGGKANDIHNEGAINVAGDLTLDGGISGDGTITFAKGSNLSVKVNKTAIANNVVNNGATLNMVFDTGFEGEYKLVTGSLDKEFDGYNNNALYNIESSKNGTYQISKKTAQEISEAVSATQNEANVIAALTAQSDTGNAKANIIANSVNDALQSGNKAEIAAAKEAASALAPDVAPVVPQTEVMVAKQVYNAIGTRLSGGINNANQGISSGDMLDDAAVWVQGLYNKSKLNNTSKAYGYDADTYGTAFGLEKYVTKATKLGAGYAYNSTDIDGHNRDTDVHTSTLFAYGEYKPNNWFVNGIASYGWSDYSETKHSTVDVKSKYDVNTFGLQAMTGYDFNLPQAFTLTPEAGVRYARIEQDGYVDDAGQSVKSRNSNIWTGVAGAKLSKAFAADNGMIFKPELRLAATYDLKNDKGNTLVTLANGTSYSVQNTSLKRFGVEVGAGVTADLSDNVELSMGYEGRFRSHYQDHTGLINAKYKF